ncbi:MAG: hypothetical protein ACOXZM_10225 [Eubacteriales bacterium]
MKKYRVYLIIRAVVFMLSAGAGAVDVDTESDHVFLADFNTPAYYFPKSEIGTGNITLKPLFPTE